MMSNLPELSGLDSELAFVLTGCGLLLRVS